MRYAGFVRAVMVGREGLVRALLESIFVDAGATSVRSHLATGNVSFESDRHRLGGVVDAVEAGLHRRLGRPTPVFVRSADELAALVALDPFGGHLAGTYQDAVVTFFAGSAPAVELPIRSRRGDAEVFAATEREWLSVTRPVGGVAGGPGGLIERLTGEQVTSRAWSTVRHVAGVLARR